MLWWEERNSQRQITKESALTWWVQDVFQKRKISPVLAYDGWAGLKRQNGKERGKGSGQRLQRPRGGSRELGRECSKMVRERQIKVTTQGFSGRVRILIFTLTARNLWKISNKRDDICAWSRALWLQYGEKIGRPRGFPGACSRLRNVPGNRRNFIYIHTYEE